MVALVGLGGGAAQGQLTSVLFEENFDSLLGSLSASVNEREGYPIVTRDASDTDSAPVPGAFSPTGPAGWVVNNGLSNYQGAPTVGNAGVPGQGIADYGVDEWQGWNFASKDFWVEAAGDQDRSTFTNATGTIAVVDPDEYFDLEPADGSTGGPSHPINGGFYNSGLVTPSIPLSTGNIYTLAFDSSWRPEAFDDGHPNNDGTLVDGDDLPIPDSDNDPLTSFVDLNNQAAEVVAVYDNGVRQTLTGLAWDSQGPAMEGDPIPATFKDNAPNEALSANFGVPTGATSVQFEFNIANAGNDWWWAIDNIDVTGLAGSEAGVNVFAEGFEGVALGDSVNERRSLTPSKVTAENTDAETFARPDSYTHTAPAGWGVDNSATPAEILGDNNVGVLEWEGWSFATREFWNFADTQDRELFDKASGVVAIADGDEWDDLGNPDNSGVDGEDKVELNTLLDTPELALPELADGETIALKFDSSWRGEDAQTAIVTVDLGAGPVELMRWESDGMSAFFHDDDVNETVLLDFDPGAATTAKFAFRYIGTDDWWWAIDNVQVGVVPEPASALLLAVALATAGAGRRARG